MTARPRMRIWNWAEVRQVLTATEGRVLHPIWFLAASTGMRHSKLLSRPLTELVLDGAAVILHPTADRKPPPDKKEGTDQ